MATIRSERVKVLYVGPDYPGSNGTCWRDAFRELGHEVRTIDAPRLVPAPRTAFGQFRRKLMARPPSHDVAGLNQAIVSQAKEFRPDFTFFIQARHILPETLEETARYGPNMGYFNDDMFNPRNQYRTFFEVIKRIDCILTTKSYNVSEFHACEAPRAVYVPNAYDPKIHYPAKLSSPEEQDYYRGDVAFIGTFRPERADFLARMAGFNEEFKLNVWGGGWPKMNRPAYWCNWHRWRQLKACIRGQELWCVNMGKAIQANKVCLGLLNHANRDLHTSRSFEIPACGGFMLGERTGEHQQYFEEDKEAVYFSSFEELMDKARFYIAHDDQRRRIAEAGYQRCLRSPYRYVDRALFAIDEYHRLRHQSLLTSNTQ